MGNKKRSASKKQTVVILLILLAAVCAYYFSRPGAIPNGTIPSSAPAAETPPAGTDTNKGELTVYVLDVGQGDSIFLLSPSGKTMLIDASESSAYPVIDDFLKDMKIDRLDVAVATHPHSDHIGGMEKVIENYEIGTFFMPGAESNTKTFENMLTALDEKNVPVEQAKAGRNAAITWDDAVEIRILSPFDVNYDDLNDYSVMLRAKYGDTAILLTGDAEGEAEKLALKELPNSYFKADVLKLGHHGSSSSTSDKFLAEVDPKVAIASVGAGNDYGHPHEETLEKLNAAGITLYRTDLNGTIKIVLDGTKVEVTPEKEG
jgi:beta-lactamase superfamily II metal-dependent hydrolase